jgi:hypothetical protein
MFQIGGRSKFSNAMESVGANVKYINNPHDIIGLSLGMAKNRGGLGQGRVRD